jgi:hypothetical protein
VEVGKVWSDGADKHAKDSIIVRLYADGKDTGRYVTLNAANNWHASFDDLPYYQDGTETKIVYTVVEEELNGYIPTYSEGEVLPGRPVSFWQHATAVENGGLYRIYAGGWALTVAADNTVTTAANDLEDENQQWKAVYANNKLMLQNVGTNRYLRVQGSTLTTTNQSRDGAAVAFSGGMLTLAGKYLEIGSGYAAITDNAANVDWTSLRVSQWTESVGMEGVGYTITNNPARYEMPQTGGMGTTSHYAFGGLLILAAVMMYVSKFGRKREKGGNCVQ